MVALALPRASFSTPNASSTDCTGETKPIASSTRSAGISNSEPGTSTGLPLVQSSFARAFSALTLPPSPTNALVAIDQSRFAPSSCEEEVRSRVGQYGHTGLRSRSGGIGSSSNWVTDFAPWRFEVPTQSEPVSPPPMTTTCLPLAHRSAHVLVAGDAPVLQRQEIHREVHAVELAPGHRQVARRFGAAGEHHRVVVGEQLLRIDRPRLAVAGADRRRADHVVHLELDALGLHLLDAPVDQPLLHLEVGDAVAQQAADAVVLLEHA